MRYYKNVSDGYVLGIGEGWGGDEITSAEYSEIMAVILSRPPRTETTDYRLKTDLTWEAYEIEPEPELPDDIDDAEAYSIIFGGGDE